MTQTSTMLDQTDLIKSMNKNGYSFKYEKCPYTREYVYVQYINGVSTGVQVMTQEQADHADNELYY